MSRNRKASNYDPALYKTPIYLVWTNMKTRCSNTAVPAFSRYGGRGITVCGKWLTFEGFYADMGAPYRDGLTLERTDNNLGYSKDNCCWATRVQQANNRRSSKRLTLGSETKTIAEWSRHLGIGSTTIIQRLNAYGWSVERALTTRVAN